MFNFQSLTSKSLKTSKTGWAKQIRLASTLISIAALLLFSGGKVWQTINNLYVLGEWEQSDSLQSQSGPGSKLTPGQEALVKDQSSDQADAGESFKSRQQVTVKRIIDGDTFETEQGEVVRYIGMDTPETKDPRKPVECFGQEAHQFHQELLAGQVVTLEADVSDRGPYGRLLRYVWFQGELVNEILVREGYAVVDTQPPNVVYQDRFRQAEQLAREEKKGLWGECEGLLEGN